MSVYFRRNRLIGHPTVRMSSRDAIKSFNASVKFCFGKWGNETSLVQLNYPQLWRWIWKWQSKRDLIILGQGNFTELLLWGASYQSFQGQLSDAWWVFSLYFCDESLLCKYDHIWALKRCVQTHSKQIILSHLILLPGTEARWWYNLCLSDKAAITAPKSSKFLGRSGNTRSTAAQ